MTKQWIIGLSFAMTFAAASPAFGQTYSLPAHPLPISESSSAPASRSWQPPAGGHTVAEYRRNAAHWEVAYLALSAIDTAETADCISRHRCEEGNFLIGKHPSVGKLLLIRGLTGAAHFGIFKFLDSKNSINSRSFAIGSAVVQAGVVALNARFVF
jgi:hypothetical protein